MVFGLPPITDPFSQTPTAPPITQETPTKSKAQLNCEAKGGTWDLATKTCKLPEKAAIGQSKLRGQDFDPTTGEPISREKAIAKTQPKQFFVAGQEGAVSQEVFERERELIRRRVQLEGADKRTLSPEEFQAQEAIELERQRVIEEETPQRRELDPLIGLGEELPVIGGVIGFAKREIGKILKERLGIKDIEGLGLEPETLRTLALTEIEKQEIERGLTDSENFGAFIESIPVIGSLASKYAGGLIETPSENAKEVKSNILKEKRRISNIETNVKLGYLPVAVADEQITDIEENVQRLESRIRLLISGSPELRFNSDFVNTIETEILATKEKIFQAKQNILTGASQDPTEIQMLLALQNIVQAGGFEI